MATEDGVEKTSEIPSRRRTFFGRNTTSSNGEETEDGDDDKGRPTKWSMGVLNDSTTHEVPGSILLLAGDRNEPLGLRNAPATTSHSSLPSQFPSRTPSLNRRQSHQARASEGMKKTTDGTIILVPQPEDSHNDPLNWPVWRRDSALICLGLYCMIGGGMTPILAAGYTNVAATYHVATAKISLTTGLYMMGLGVGSVFASPTAILYGKRPVYLVGCILFACTSVWCAASPTYHSLLVARIFQGIAVSPVECLPSATIAEIFFLHERAYRVGIYTLLLLGGKNLVPLVSAAIIQSLGWRWVFWTVAIITGSYWFLLFLFVPETFWDRTPRPKNRQAPKKFFANSLFSKHKLKDEPPNHDDENIDESEVRKIETSQPNGSTGPRRASITQRPTRTLHVGFVPGDQGSDEGNHVEQDGEHRDEKPALPINPTGMQQPSPSSTEIERSDSVNLGPGHETPPASINNDGQSISRPPAPPRYTTFLRDRPRLTFVQQLKPWNGRLHYDNWFRVAVRPFILYAYPSVLWSAGVYACSIGWLIVLSESVTVVYREKDTYNFSALSAGLIYISPFIGGVLGTAVAGKLSDIIVRAMARRNGGLYEPEFRLVMAAPVAVTTVIGLMGFGLSVQVRDAWIVPTIFFGIISFGCSLGSTTSITFCVDSYRQYAGEALVTLNFSKNIFHGLVFSLFFTSWLEDDGSKKVFIWIGVIQLVLMAFTVPMYIFGKRARMWTVRKNFMEKF